MRIIKNHAKSHKEFQELALNKVTFEIIKKLRLKVEFIKN